MKKLSIIVPVYNEEQFIIQILDRLRTLELVSDFEKEIIVVNDSSTDSTHSLITEYIETKDAKNLFKYILQPVNSGKGYAVRTGIKVANGHYIVIQDADLEYNPKEINKLLIPIIKGEADIIYGSRFQGEPVEKGIWSWHRSGNKFLTAFSNLFTKLKLTDMETCYKLFKAEILKSLHLYETRFGFEPEVTAKISRIPGIRIVETKISYKGRSYTDGKKIGWKDGVRAIYCILKYNLPLSLFCKNEAKISKSYN